LGNTAVESRVQALCYTIDSTIIVSIMKYKQE